jgi:hypothetical protein
MIRFLEQFLLSGLPCGRDNGFRRIDGEPDSNIIVFLPWHTPYELAWRAGLIGTSFVACYEMPETVVSSEPGNCIDALENLIADAENVQARSRHSAKSFRIIGLSIGNFPATILANRWGARLCSVCSADRGDSMIWESPAARHVRIEAEARGYTTEDFTHALEGYHPIQNLENLGAHSCFIVSPVDQLVPAHRTRALANAVRSAPSQPVLYTISDTHLMTMVKSARIQRWHCNHDQTVSAAA